MTSDSRPGGRKGAEQPAQDAPRDPTGPQAFQVLCDRSGRVGVLSYLPPEDGGRIQLGDGVEVPFGRSSRTGVVVGTSPDMLATRPILRRTVRRTGPAELQVAGTLAAAHMVEPQQVQRRLGPASGHDDEPYDTGPVHLVEGDTIPVEEKDVGRRRLLLRRPGTPYSRLAAQEAVRIAEETGGQILVLCPTGRHVTAVCAEFETGAVRVDSRAPAGAWAGFVTGSVQVAVGTRTAALYRPRRLGGIIVVDAEHPGHTESSQPATTSREVASLRASASRCQLTIITPCPDPAALGSNVKLLTAGRPSDWPRIITLDRKNLPPHERLTPVRLKTLVRQHVADGLPVRVVAERRRTMLRCRQCRTAWPCRQDGCVPHLCRHEPEGSCACGSRTRIPVGFDADRLKDLIPEGQTVTIAELSRGKPGGLVVVFDLSPAMRAAEWVAGTTTARLVTTAAEAAGPDGTLLVCSWDSLDSTASALLRRRDQTAVAKEMWRAARAAGAPPFNRLVTVRASRKKPIRTDGWPGRIYGPRRLPNGDWEIIVALPETDIPQLTPHIAKVRRAGRTLVQIS